MSVVLIEVAYSINDDNERKGGLDYTYRMFSKSTNVQRNES